MLYGIMGFVLGKINIYVFGQTIWLKYMMILGLDIENQRGNQKKENFENMFNMQNFERENYIDI